MVDEAIHLEDAAAQVAAVALDTFFEGLHVG
jgi:hypothetical protein